MLHIDYWLIYSTQRCLNNYFPTDILGQSSNSLVENIILDIQRVVA